MQSRMHEKELKGEQPLWNNEIVTTTRVRILYVSEGKGKKSTENGEVATLLFA